MPKRTEHTWREITDADEQRTVRASRVAGQWRLSSKLQGEEFWEHHEPIAEGDLRSLRDVLWRKYQRKRIPWEHLREIDRMLGDDES